MKIINKINVKTSPWRTPLITSLQPYSFFQHSFLLSPSVTPNKEFVLTTLSSSLDSIFPHSTIWSALLRLGQTQSFLCSQGEWHGYERDRGHIARGVVREKIKKPLYLALVGPYLEGYVQLFHLTKKRPEGEQLKSHSWKPTSRTCFYSLAKWRHLNSKCQSLAREKTV